MYFPGASHITHLAGDGSDAFYLLESNRGESRLVLRLLRGFDYAQVTLPGACAGMI
jgi:hypothetical protein